MRVPLRPIVHGVVDPALDAFSDAQVVMRMQFIQAQLKAPLTYLEVLATYGDAATLVKSLVLNADGRNPDGLLYAHDALQSGRYRLVFGVADYFRAQGVALPEPPFLDQVSLDFGVADPAAHYHVPLLVSPWSYSTYRGS